MIEPDEGLDPHIAYDNDAIYMLDLGILGDEDRLCPRCQRFDIQSFARSKNHRRGYLLRDINESARNGCDFCSLLLASIKNVEKPYYFYLSFNGRKATNPDLYVHMPLSENYSQANERSGSPGLKFNRLRTELGDRFSEGKKRD
jgi:hypothetical protein